MKSNRFISVGLFAALFCYPHFTLAQGSKGTKGIRQVRSETLRDKKLEKTILKTLGDIVDGEDTELLDSARYFYNKVDLNGDGNKEVLVYLFGRGWCGTGGCSAMIFQSINGNYRLVTDMSVSRNPLIVSPRKTKGWHDLIMFIYGGGILPGYYVLLRFNGHTYPSNPTVSPSVKAHGVIRGTAYLVGEPSQHAGIALNSTMRQ